MKERVKEYKNSIVGVLNVKYKISEFEAKKWIREYDFNSVLKVCNYAALHDDPEIWADAIYQRMNDEKLLEM